VSGVRLALQQSFFSYDVLHAIATSSVNQP
jgi:hypothetical protein